MPILTLVRHGQSRWNLENRFTGWTDQDLTEQGEAEAKSAGRLLKEAGLRPHAAFTSVLTRAVRTLWLALHEMDMCYLPYRLDWRLNERHYGALQGLNKADTAKRYGDEQVHIWRRSYDVPPPPLEPNDPRHPSRDPRYAGVDPALLPAGESLKDTLERLLPCWRGEIRPALTAGGDLLLAAHGNSIRALLKELMGISDQDITSLEIPTGNPLVLDLGPGLSVDGARYLDAGRAGPLP